MDCKHGTSFMETEEAAPARSPFSPIAENSGFSLKPPRRSFSPAGMACGPRRTCSPLTPAGMSCVPLRSLSSTVSPSDMAGMRRMELRSSLRTTTVRLICIDFDMTLIDTHTGGSWDGTAAQLATHARPMVLALIEEAVAADISVSIVTFSTQATLLYNVLSIVLPREVVGELILRTADPTAPWSPVHGIPTRASGKLHHVASSWEAAGLGDAQRCEWSSVMLVDDDKTNVDRAAEWGARTAWFMPSISGCELQLAHELKVGLCGPAPPPSPDSYAFVTPPRISFSHMAGDVRASHD